MTAPVPLGSCGFVSRARKAGPSIIGQATEVVRHRGTILLNGQLAFNYYALYSGRNY